MSEDNSDIEANGVNVSDDGNPLTGVHLSQPFIARISRPGVVIGLVITGMLTMLSMTILVTYLAPSVNRLTTRTEIGARERQELLDQNVKLQNQLETILDEQRQERLVDDCLTMYRNDIEVAKGVSQVTLGDNLASAILGTDPNDNERLAQEVFDADADLRTTLTALNEYLLIDPPPGACPHD